MKRLIFCEPCCGSAAVTIRLLQRYGKPPISYMGGKSGYADVILDALGLVPGQGCDGIVLADVGPWAAVWATLGGAMEPEDAARWLCCAGTSYRVGEPSSGYNQIEADGSPIRDTHGATRPWMQRVMPVIGNVPLPASKAVANIIRQWKDEEPRALWNRLKAEGWPSLLPVKGGRWLGPQSVSEVASWTLTGAWSYVQGFNEKGSGPVLPGERRQDTKAVAVAVAKMPTFPPLACYQGSANEMLLPDDLTGWVVYFDPPYLNTSGYSFGNLGREEVLRLAKEWAFRGAIVAVSEAEPLPLEGWHHVQIDHARKGAKRTFSKQQSEWLTMSVPPANVPAKQFSLFGSAQ